MYYFYVLKSEKNGKYYFGTTSDLQKRFSQHNKGQSKSTKSGVPWKVVYYEAYASRALAVRRERSIKHYGQTWTRLKGRLEAE